VTAPPNTASTTTGGSSVPPVTTPPTPTVDPERTGDRHFPGSKDV
jgi:hypothetical protein